jgi:molybdopterin/thiamine biosynthesis adenylyltransferase
MRKIFSEEQLQRYSRQIILTEIGHAGQAKLCNSSVLIIGAGGLGSPAALYCAAAGVGVIGIADDDTVDLSNLHRQVIHTQAGIGRNKADSAAEAVHRIHSETTVRPYRERITASSILSIISGYDFVIDATDNFPAKFLINDACVKSSVPFSHAGVIRFTGQTMTVMPRKTACYRCVFGSLPPLESVATCSDAGVLGPVAGVIGTIQATEAIKYITGAGSPLAGQILTYDALSMEFRKIDVKRNHSCAVCGIDPDKIELRDETAPSIR